MIILQQQTQEKTVKVSKNKPIVISGAGLSGLCLAQGLLREGFEVQIYERDSSAHARKQGYRITIDEKGAKALKQCLPSHLFKAVLASASSFSEVNYFRFTNKNLGEIFKLTFKNKNNPEMIGQVDRETLRNILLSGIEDRVHFGNETERAEVDQDGVTLHLTDGSTVQASIVIGADGVHSKLRDQFLPHNPIIDTGFRGIYGKTTLKQGVPLLPKQLENSGVMAIGQPGNAFFFTSMLFNEKPENVFKRLVKDRTSTVSNDYVMWAILLKDSNLPENILELSPNQLHQVALKKSTTYHPALQMFIKHADVDYTVSTKITAAAEPTTWPTSRVTFLGDAVHSMPPTGAHGGNTALRDAALLYAKLKEFGNENKTIESALREYQKEMLDYAFKEVKSSVKMLNNINMSNPILRFTLLHSLPWLRSIFGKKLIK